MQSWLISFLSLNLALSLAWTPLFAQAKDPEPPEFSDKGEKADNCEPYFGQNTENPFREGLIRSMDQYVENLKSGRAELESTLHDHLDQIKSDSKKPELADTTMRALLSAYDYDKPQTGRMQAMRDVNQKLKSDPYLQWLATTNKVDLTKVIEFFLQPLNTGGSANLKLSYALLRLRAVLEPGFDPVAKSTVFTLLILSALEHKASEDLQTLRYIDTHGAWEMAHSLKQAKSNRKRIVDSIRPNSPDKISISDYEKLKAFLRDDNPDTEILRQYCLAVDGTLKDKTDQSEMSFLKDEAERIRQDSGLSKKITFNSEFVRLWSSIWGAGLSYDRVLLRHFYQPQTDRYKLENQIHFLNLFIELAEQVQSKSLNKYYQQQVMENLGRYPYLLAFTQSP